MSKKPKKAKKQKLADQYDKHVLYQDAVQCVEAELDFVDITFKSLRGRNAHLLREDFCGTANTSSEWVRRRRKNQAVAVDLDEAVLEWGREHNVTSLSKGQQSRITLLNHNVMNVKSDPMDVILAMNFSYWIFNERATLKQYFKSVHRSLNDEGVFYMDCYGGYDAFREMKERRDCDYFTYIWDQEYYDPITGAYVCHIHFKFPDGSQMKKAFSYHWRLWTLPEIREILKEAGFSNVSVFWQEAAEDDEEDDFRIREHGDADAGWISYIVAEK